MCFQCKKRSSKPSKRADLEEQPMRTREHEAEEEPEGSIAPRLLPCTSKAAASGEVTPAEASDFCSLLDTQRRAIELSDIEEGLARLEANGGQRA